MREAPVVRVVRVRQVGEPRPEGVVVRADERRGALQVEVIRDGDEPAGRHRRVDRAAGVRQDEAPHSEPSQDPDAEDDAVGRMTLVEVRPTLEHRDRCPAEAADDEHARVADRRRERPAGDLLVRDLDRLLDRVGERSQPAPEHDADRRLHTAPCPHDLDGVVELAQVDPSCPRCSIIVTIHSTASAGSSVRRRSARSSAETSPSASISPRTQSSISSQ